MSGCEQVASTTLGSVFVKLPMQEDCQIHRISSMNEEASYACDSCGEEIVIPIDRSAGNNQEYVEDCPVCCNPNVIHVRITNDDGVTVSARAE